MSDDIGSEFPGAVIEPLDSQVQALLGARDAQGQPDVFELPPEQARAAYRQILQMSDTDPVAVGTSERSIEGPDGALRLRIYTPPAAASASRGLLLYLHGGGFVVGDPDCYEGLCTRLCASTGCVLVQVDYRLAPEHPFPAAVEDCYAALLWVHRHAQALGADPARIAVIGDSAGGNLAAVMALLARDRSGPALVMQALVYPVMAAAPGGYPSYARFGEGLILTEASAGRFHAMYFEGAATAPDYRGAPLLAEDLHRLPPAVVAVAGHDVLHDEGVEYARRLRQAGNRVTLLDFATLTHGFISMGGMVAAASRAIDGIAAALRDALDSAGAGNRIHGR